MDRESPDNYIECTEDGLRDAEVFINYTRALQSTRIYPCITPRFIPTCTIEMMKGNNWGLTSKLTILTVFNIFYHGMLFGVSGLLLYIRPSSIHLL